MEALKWRGIFKDVTNQDALDEIIASPNQKAFYIGIDPTADDLHLGHLQSFIVSKLMVEHFNLIPIFVIGGLTATIGDPSGKNVERNLIDEKTVKLNSEALEKRINFLCDRLQIKTFKIINNLSFYQDLDIADFFRIFGKNFNVNRMLAKDMVKKRLDSGISYTEFSYQIFQAIDFYNLFLKDNCVIQIGGSDQWGNIVSGVELIHKMIPETEFHPVGITTNLILDSNGNKIGKSAGNALWVNEAKVNAYNFYQYFLNLDDDTAKTLLRTLTLVDKTTYEQIVSSHQSNPKARMLQNNLAERFLTLFYSKTSFEQAITLSNYLYQKDYDHLNQDLFMLLRTTLPIFKVNNLDQLIIDFLVTNDLIKSRREAREFIQARAIKINNQPFIDDQLTLKALEQFKNNTYNGFIVDIGKKTKIIFE